MQRSDNSVREFIVSAIDSGAYAPHARLPTERDLCDQLMVSRSAVRNALAVLEGEGRIVRIAGSGTYVADINRNEKNILHDLPQITSPAQVMEARLTIEPQLAQLVASHATAADFAEIQRCHEAGVKSETMEEFEIWDAALHQAIAEAAHNPLVIEAYNLITRARDQGEWGELKRQSLTDQRRALYQQDHASIVTALKSRDAAKAEQDLRAHLLRVRANLLGH
jgi:GntR family transcriptional regulator, uxu operon transcriptional repressor